MMAATQREQTLKFELLVRSLPRKSRPRCLRNYHLDHFAVPFEIKTADGAIAHSCA